jgi:hypothetical protein
MTKLGSPSSLAALILSALFLMASCRVSENENPSHGPADIQAEAARKALPNRDSKRRLLAATALGRDLSAAKRDALLRAASYLQKSAGFSSPKPDSLKALQEYGQQSLHDLEEKDSGDLIRLIEGYQEFVQLWSPYYLD